MKILSLETWEVNAEEKELNLSGNKVGDSIVEEVIIQTVTANPFTVSAYVADEPTEVKVINMASMSVAEDTNSAGVYMIISEGYAKIKFNFTGSGIVIVKKLG